MRDVHEIVKNKKYIIMVSNKSIQKPQLNKRYQLLIHCKPTCLHIAEVTCFNIAKMYINNCVWYDVKCGYYTIL